MFELFKLFFKLGCVAFGGPVAHIAMMEEEVVRKRKWLSDQEFLDLIALTHLIPGPNSTEMAMHCGYKRKGFLGLLTAGFAFIFPAALITLVFCWFYQTYHHLPFLEHAVFGIRAIVFAIILSALWRLGKKALKSKEFFVIALIACCLLLFSMNAVVVVIFVSGLSFLFLSGFKFSSKKLLSLSPSSLICFIPLTNIFFSFVKIGSILFGGGYVLIAYLEDEFVHRLGILTQESILEAVAIGQMTPGPILTTATAVGYQLSGISGAIVATVGIFLPAFFFVWMIHPLASKMRENKKLSLLLDVLNASTFGVMIAALSRLFIGSMLDWKSVMIFFIGGLILMRCQKANIFAMIGLGAVLGILVHIVIPAKAGI